MVEELLLYFL